MAYSLLIVLMLIMTLIFIDEYHVEYLIILLTFIPVLIMTFTLRSFYIINTNGISRFTTGGKNKNSEFCISIDQIVKIRVLKKNSTPFGLEIYCSEDDQAPARLIIENVTNFLDEILSINPEIPIIGEQDSSERSN